MTPSPRLAQTLIVLVATGFGVSTLQGQGRELAFDRPEAWGMKYGTSLALFTGFGAPREVEKGSIELGLEMAHVPHLSDAQRRIGFDGIKLEDMNKTAVFARFRARLGIGSGWGASVGIVPPVEVGGAKPLMVSASVGGPVVDGERLRVGVRGFGHIGRIEGDITCDAETVAAGVDPIRNAFNCAEVSEDELKQRVGGLEISGALPLGTVEPYVAVGINYLDTSFQVHAFYSGSTSDELLETSGVTLSGSLGVAVEAAESLRLTAEAFYTPLSVVRPPETGANNDGLFHLRGMISYKVR